jgi:hypothetical protein
LRSPHSFGLSIYHDGHSTYHDGHSTGGIETKADHGVPFPALKTGQAPEEKQM